MNNYTKTLFDNIIANYGTVPFASIFKRKGQKANKSVNKFLTRVRKIIGEEEWKKVKKFNKAKKNTDIEQFTEKTPSTIEHSKTEPEKKKHVIRDRKDLKEHDLDRDFIQLIESKNSDGRYKTYLNEERKNSDQPLDPEKDIEFFESLLF
jgi:hypothetical protein